MGKLASDRAALSPVTLAEWMNAGRCPREALREAGRLFIELGLAETRAQVGGTDVRWAGANRSRRSLDRLEVNADSIQCCWQDEQLTEDWDAAADADWSGVAAWWNSLPPRERPIHKPGCKDLACACDVGVDALRRRRPKRVAKTDRLPLGLLFRRWRALPAAERPDFPLDPVVQSWTGGELSAEDYMPDFQRYQHDVREAVDKDAREMNGRDVPTVYESVAAALEKHGKTRTENEVDLLVGLVRATGGPQQEQQVITGLIGKLGRLEDIDHGRVRGAFDYALGKAEGKEHSKTLLNMYNNERQERAGAGLTGRNTSC